MRQGATVLVWADGSVARSAQVQQAALQEMGFEDVSVLADGPTAAVVAARCGAGAADKQRSQAAWRQEVSVRLPLGDDEGRDEDGWCVYPGLFAGGGLDIMTEVLLKALPSSPPPGLKVLDFACGAGSIAASILRRVPSAEVTLLDADAVATAACRENLPGAKRLIVSDCWRELEHRKLRFHWIVSNPPVHCGHADDFRVLRELCEGAGPRLRPRGVLWIVAQEYVPVGGLLGDFADVSCPFDDGRFVVWRAADWQGSAAHGGEADEPLAGKRPATEAAGDAPGRKRRRLPE